MKLPEHGRYAYSCIPERADYSWPGGKRLALCVCVAVEHFAFGAGIGEDFAVTGAAQTHRNYGWRDYGQRIGLWRLLETLDELRVPLALAVNSMVLRNEPRLAERLRRRSDEIVAHGRTSSESTASMWVDDEQEAIRQSTTSIKDFFGASPAGWASPGVVESASTLDVLAAQGYDYVLDWPADDQPFWLKTETSRILSLPASLELSDVTAIAHRRHSAREFADMIVNQFEEMHAQARQRPMVLPLMFHPYIVGQPFRLRPLRKALSHCLSDRFSEELWLARPGEIARHCRSMPDGLIP